MGTEKFCLKWNDFEANISHAFRDIRDAKDFLDVTLVCEEDEQLQAHKVILSACSPFFRKILQRNPHQHPLLYLKGVKYADLQSVLNFMYHGEVNVAQDELNSFLAVAEELKVKGLTQNNSSSSNTKSSPPPPAKSSRSVDRDSSAAPPPKRSRPSVPAVVAPPPQPEEEDDDDIQEVVPVKSEPRDGNSSVITAGGVAGPALAPSGGGSVAGDMYSAPAAAGEQSIAGEEDYGEEGDYEDYSGYGEGYDSAVMDPNMTGGVDGNKGDEVDKTKNKRKKPALDDPRFQTLQIHMSPGPQPQEWTCHECGKAFKGKKKCMNHLESLHFRGIITYTCDRCNNNFDTYYKWEHHRKKKGCAMEGGGFIGNTLEPEVDIQMGDMDYDHVVYSDDPLDMDGGGDEEPKQENNLDEHD